MSHWHFLPDQHFQCSQCGRCCQGWRILVDQATVKCLQETGEASRLQEIGGRHYTQRDEQQRCTFLTVDQQCQLHQVGKPAGCRQFPFRLKKTPDGIFVGASFYCPSIQANQGLPLAAYQQQLQELAAELKEWGSDGLWLWGDSSLAWKDYRILEAYILGQTEIDLALAQALWALAQYSLKPKLGLSYFLDQARIALEPPDEPLVLMEHYWFGKIMQYLGESGKLVVAPPDKSLQGYLRASIWCKTLINHRPLLGNLALMFLVPRFYQHWVTTLGSSEAALAACEKKLVTHPNNLDTLILEMSDDFRQLDPLS